MNGGSSTWYRIMLPIFLVRERVRKRMWNVWFEQYDVTVQTARQSMTVLTSVFTVCRITRFGDIRWTARSPDLTTPKLLLWSTSSLKCTYAPPLYPRTESESQKFNGAVLHPAIPNFKQLSQAMYRMSCTSSEAPPPHKKKTKQKGRYGYETAIFRLGHGRPTFLWQRATHPLRGAGPRVARGKISGISNRPNYVYFL
jgi:hypothetical protein